MLIVVVLVWQVLYVTLDVKQSIQLMKLKKMVLSVQLVAIVHQEQQNKLLRNVQLVLKD